jgi:signal transduction histidine kinase
MKDHPMARIAIEVILDERGMVLRQQCEPTFPGAADRLVGRNIADLLTLGEESALRRCLGVTVPAEGASGLDLVAFPDARPMLLRFHLLPDGAAGGRQVLFSADGTLTGFNGMLRAALGAVHELNNTIGTIAGFADLMKDGGLPADKSRRYLERIETSVQEARAIGEKLSHDVRRLAAETARAAT